MVTSGRWPSISVSDHMHVMVLYVHLLGETGNTFRRQQYKILNVSSSINGSGGHYFIYCITRLSAEKFRMNIWVMKMIHEKTILSCK